jgi:elongation factor P--(R)-beta-lysine ligase
MTSKFPARTRRQIPISKAREGFEQGALQGAKWLAGRIIGILDDGFVLQDESGRMDLVYKGEVNVGDIVEGLVVAEPREDGEGLSSLVYIVKEMLVLTPCSDEFFLRKDDPNYRRMVVDRNVKEILTTRQKIIKHLRDFFWDSGFTEVDTPELVKLPGMEPYLDVFKTTFVGLPHDGRPAETEDLYLITSPEYAMKKLLVGGYENIFQVTRSFRNKEHLSSLHNPEFTILEWYRAFSDYRQIMEDTENLVHSLCRATNGDSFFTYRDQKIDTLPPWPRLKVKDAFFQYAGIGPEIFENEEAFRVAVAAKGYVVGKDTTFDDLFFMVFMNEIEPKLGLQKPVILYEYPASMAALSKKCEGDSRYAERFEVYAAGVELCNAFTELNDPDEQKARLEHEREVRLTMGKEDYPVDQSFLRALQFGMPPSGGIALGVDRLVMLLTGTPDIRNVIFFPHGEGEIQN